MGIGLRRLRGIAAVLEKAPKLQGVDQLQELAQPLLDDTVIVALGDLFLDGTFAPFPVGAGLVFWRGAPAGEAAQNFGIATRPDGFASAVVEKPVCEGATDPGTSRPRSTKWRPLSGIS